MYRVAPYYLSKILAELPMQLFTPMLYLIIVYWGVGLTITAGQFFYAYLIMVLLVLGSASFGYFISSIFDQEESAVAIAPVIMMPIMLFSGFFSNAGSYPNWIGWIQYISPIKYSLEALVWN